MHGSVMEFLRVEIAALGISERSVLDVGALNVNGSGRRFFSGPYWGVDMQPGPGVDEVVNAHDLQDSENLGPFEVIVCTEMLEHDDAPWLSLTEMRAVCADGYLLLTCRGYDHRGCFPVHEYPRDLWRFSVAGVEALLRHTGWLPMGVRLDPEAPGVFAVARCD